ncbi:hypothetical protein [Bradyrhizobium elkanii]|uniref:hypothetical protein n=1 Tax=Bradyrhizobium elkanii TaxID=29448 RepID=UPI00084125D2|nr:hypothetical protein [Bradyrhizobium elkanii]ODM71697.1 hypothetical protein A6X20_07080 [Bradyrhizobium elkanii]ODM79070.1 hypothetical protein A6452_28665 [Bradyrhizobium elkanii]
MKIVGGEESDPSHWSHQFREAPSVYLNGILMEHVTEADAAAGYIVIQEYDGDRLRLAPDGQSIATRKITGRVDIVGERGPWA